MSAIKNVLLKDCSQKLTILVETSLMFRKGNFTKENCPVFQKLIEK